MQATYHWLHGGETEAHIVNFSLLRGTSRVFLRGTPIYHIGQIHIIHTTYSNDCHTAAQPDLWGPTNST